MTEKKHIRFEVRTTPQFAEEIFDLQMKTRQTSKAQVVFKAVKLLRIIVENSEGEDFIQLLKADGTTVKIYV